MDIMEFQITYNPAVCSTACSSYPANSIFTNGNADCHNDNCGTVSEDKISTMTALSLGYSYFIVKHVKHLRKQWRVHSHLQENSTDKSTVFQITYAIIHIDY